MKIYLLGLALLNCAYSSFALNDTLKISKIYCEEDVAEIYCEEEVTVVDLEQVLDQMSNHITGSSILSGAQITSAQARLESNIGFLEGSTTAIAKAFEVVEQFERIKGPLFVSSSTAGGFSRTSGGLQLERFMLYLQQSIMDFAYTTQNLNTNRSLFENVKYEISSYFPGSVNPPSNSNVSYTVKISGKHTRVSGAPSNYENEDARRPTGCYLAPGSIAEVTVPRSLVGVGASVLVGAHTWDNTVKPTHRRLDRVTKKYDITSQTINVANPLGGGVYINIPIDINIGTIDVTIKNVVRSPYYANTVANKTTLSQWQNTQRNHVAPWADFESEKVMMQVPTSWINEVNDPSSMMADWDTSMDGISEMLGRPLIRSKTVVYSQVDLQLRGSANFPGYPQANVTYNPNTNYNGNHNHYLVRGPRNDRTNGIAVFFHELGHAEKIYKFLGEVEAFVNFLWVSVYNKKFGVDIDTALVESSTTNVKHTVDEAAISWMITENFRLGTQMSTTTGQFRQEFSYQPRGYAKYADVVRLFGWEALEQFYKTLNNDYDNGTYESANRNVNNVTTDSRVLRMSVAAGYDLRPLIHFWGKHPVANASLANSIAASGVKQSVAIYDQLMEYKSIIPMTNTAFRNFGLQDFSQGAINGSSTFENNVSQSYTAGFFKKWWNDYGTDEAQATVGQVQNIIDLYFPDGRPSETSCSWEIIAQENEVMNFSGTKTIRYGANGVYVIKTISGNTRCNNSAFGDPIQGVAKSCEECKGEETLVFTPDPAKKYYIDIPFHNLRVAATGESEAPFTTTTTTTGANVEWSFVDRGNGYWQIRRAAGGSKPGLRTDNASSADMQETTSNGEWTYYEMEKGYTEGTYFVTLPDGPTNFRRLQVDNRGTVNMVSTASNRTWESFTFTEATQVSDFRISDLRIEAEDYDAMSGIQTESSVETVENVGYINDGDWLRFDDLNLSGLSNLDARVATRTVGGTIEVRTGSPTGTLIGSITVNNTGGFQNWNTTSTTISNTVGTQDVYLVFRGGNGYLFNVNWIEFNNDSTSNKDITAVDQTTNIIIYPNPVVSSATIQGAANSTVIIYDMNGAEILTIAISSENETIDLSILAIGIYYAKVESQTNVSVIKIVKQ